MQGSKSKIAVGMSGGVDSSVVALTLKEQGHDVVGVTMQVWSGGVPHDPTARNACYGPDEPEDIAAAERVAKTIGIPFFVIDLREEFRKTILDYFRLEYAAGRTPNPCVHCNWKIKFGALVQKLAEKIPFDFFATGHYARISFDESRQRYLLLRGLDPKKDQAYFLYHLSQQQLAKSLFPIGGLLKKDIKDKARILGLGLEKKAESQNFVTGGHESLLGDKAANGPIVDGAGKRLGEHRGIAFYTIGQRKGLGLSAERPYYVTRIDAATNTVVVGEKADLYGSRFLAGGLNWIACADLPEPMTVTAKIRYAATEARALITLKEPDRVLVELAEPQASITPGQSVVFYDGEVVVGGGTIL